MQTGIDTAIEVWHVEETVLTDGSKVFDVIGANDAARVVFNCVDKHAAYDLQALLMSSARISGTSAEAV
jgi:hypothetical protein